MIRFVGRQLRELYRRGFALFLLAPMIIAIVAVPEFVQHWFEIRSGMFESVERARALANDPQRWAFGYAKLAGLLIAMFAAARFWSTQVRGGRWWDVREIEWLRLAVAIALFALLPALADLLHGPVYWIAYTALSTAVLPLVFVILGALFGARRPGLVESLQSGWRWLPLLVLLLVAAYLPPMAAHYGLHHVARGLATPLVWALMTLDSLVVGLIAAFTGAAFALAYDAGWPLASSIPAPASPPSPLPDRAPAGP